MMKERSSALAFENDLFDFGGQRHYEIIQFKEKKGPPFAANLLT